MSEKQRFAAVLDPFEDEFNENEPNLPDQIPLLKDPPDSPADFWADDDWFPYLEEMEAPRMTQNSKSWKKRAKKYKKQRDNVRARCHATTTERDLYKTAYAEQHHMTQQLNKELREMTLAHEKAQNENRERQAALVFSEAIRRGCGAEAFQDFSFGGFDALLSRGAWMFDGGNLDRTIPHHKPSPHGYRLNSKQYCLLPDTPSRVEDGEDDEDDE